MDNLRRAILPVDFHDPSLSYSYDACCTSRLRTPTLRCVRRHHHYRALCVELLGSKYEQPNFVDLHHRRPRLSGYCRQQQ